MKGPSANIPSLQFPAEGDLHQQRGEAEAGHGVIDVENQGAVGRESSLPLNQRSLLGTSIPFRRTPTQGQPTQRSSLEQKAVAATTCGGVQPLIGRLASVQVYSSPLLSLTQCLRILPLAMACPPPARHRHHHQPQSHCCGTGVRPTPRSCRRSCSGTDFHRLVMVSNSLIYRATSPLRRPSC